MQKSRILVLAKDTVISALMGSLVELAGHRPIFPAAGEHPLHAISRVRAELVLLDCEHDIACEDEAYRLAEAAGSRIVLFSAQRDQIEAEEMGRQREVGAFMLPIQFGEFTGRISEALQST